MRPLAMVGVCLRERRGVYSVLQSLQTTSAAQQKWSEFPSSPELRAPIDDALQNNRELNKLSARKGEYLPRISVGASVGVEKVGEHASQGASDDAASLPKHGSAADPARFSGT
jgi:outer membrane protein, multidrug efflux system